MLALLALLATGSPTPAAPPQTFRAICYHEVRDTVVDGDSLAVTTADLVEQFEWLAAHDYHPVSIDDLVAAHEGRKLLPENAVLLTFDDARKSVVTRVLPILKAYRYPAVVSVVGSWIEGADDPRPAYGGPNLLPLEFATWDDLRELVASGLVEIASHSHASHQFVPANPQGGMQAAFVTRRYDLLTRTYETEERYRTRVHDDLLRNTHLIEQRLGVRPRVVAWPYGLSNGLLEGAAASLGLSVSLGLEWGTSDVRDLRGIRRYAVGANTRIADFAWALRWTGARDARRVLCVDPAALTRGDAFEPEFDRLLERVKDLGVTTVYLKAFVEDPATGRARALYFPNRHLPVEADVFAHVAQRLNALASVEVFAWMPVAAFELPDLVPPSSPAARRALIEITEDLAAHVAIQGVYFQDPRPPDASEPTRVDLTDDLVARLRFLRDTHLTTARGVWIPAPTSDAPTTPLAERIAPYDAHYDTLALILDARGAWDTSCVADLARDVRALPREHARELVLAPARRGEREAATTRLAHDLRTLMIGGVSDFGTSPEQDLGVLDLDRLRSAVSVEDYPYRRP